MGGPEFEELQGHVLVMYKALYGTRSGGACWHDKLFDILHQMDFKPSRADPDMWMKSSKDGSHYEYIAVCVDDLAIWMKDPNSFCDRLKEKYKLKLKGVGPISYHLGCVYIRPFPYEGSISKFRDQIDVSRDFLDSRFHQNVDYKLRFEVLLIRSLGFPYQQEGISKFPKNEIEVSLHPQDSLNWWESLTPSL